MKKFIFSVSMLFLIASCNDVNKGKNDSFEIQKISPILKNDSLIFSGLLICRSSNYPLSKIKTQLHRVSTWNDTTFKLQTDSDTLESLNYHSQKLSTNCKSLVFKKIAYINSLIWNLDKSESKLWLNEIHFDSKEDFNQAKFRMDKNMPKFELGMVSTSYYSWFTSNQNIYLLQFCEVLGPEIEPKVDYLEKAKIDFENLLR
jgi:hypothetical protein